MYNSLRAADHIKHHLFKVPSLLNCCYYCPKMYKDLINSGSSMRGLWCDEVCDVETFIDCFTSYIFSQSGNFKWGHTLGSQVQGAITKWVLSFKVVEYGWELIS